MSVPRPLSNVQPPVSSVQCPLSAAQWPVSVVRCPVSAIHCPRPLLDPHVFVCRLFSKQWNKLFEIRHLFFFVKAPATVARFSDVTKLLLVTKKVVSYITE
jgi:hypothetical protein